MTLYIFDTDHLNLYGRNNSALMMRLLSANVRLITTAINLEEQMKGRLAQIAEAQDEIVKGEPLSTTIINARKEERY